MPKTNAAPRKAVRPALKTDVQARQAKPEPKPYKLRVEGGGLAAGMYFLVNPDGGKYWRWDYRFAGKRKTLALGAYPQTGLATARGLYEKARVQLAAGTDPGEAKKADKRAKRLVAKNSFDAVARAWLVEYKQTVSDSSYDHAKSWMENDVPHLVRSFFNNPSVAYIGDC